MNHTTAVYFFSQEFSYFLTLNRIVATNGQAERFAQSNQ